VKRKKKKKKIMSTQILSPTTVFTASAGHNTSNNSSGSNSPPSTSSASTSSSHNNSNNNTHLHHTTHGTSSILTQLNYRAVNNHHSQYGSNVNRLKSVFFANPQTNAQQQQNSSDDSHQSHTAVTTTPSPQQVIVPKHISRNSNVNHPNVVHHLKQQPFVNHNHQSTNGSCDPFAAAHQFIHDHPSYPTSSTATTTASSSSSATATNNSGGGGGSGTSASRSRSLSTPRTIDPHSSRNSSSIVANRISHLLGSTNNGSAKSKDDTNTSPSRDVNNGIQSSDHLTRFQSAKALFAKMEEETLCSSAAVSQARPVVTSSAKIGSSRRSLSNNYTTNSFSVNSTPTSTASAQNKRLQGEFLIFTFYKKKKNTSHLFTSDIPF
jgi:hypothetical protein